MSEDRARYGWESDFPDFTAAQPSHVRERLNAFVRDASPEQKRAWADSIPPLQQEVEEVLPTCSVTTETVKSAPSCQSWSRHARTAMCVGKASWTSTSEGHHLHG